jgi:hypothetical protein
VCAASLAQEPAPKPVEAAPPNEKTAPAKSEEKATLPFQIQLLETDMRFESNGDSRKEVHTIVKINELAGARQFSRLGFDYNRAFQQVEIPLVKISHANGGTSEILPSAITDAPNPLVQEYPAYHDVRVKSVRILGLQDGDTIEYRVITTTTKHPLAPDFWLEHSFDRSGQVLEEDYTLDAPGNVDATSNMFSVASFDTPHHHWSVPPTTNQSPDGERGGRSIYRWHLTSSNIPPEKRDAKGKALPDVLITSFTYWQKLSHEIHSRLPEWNDEDEREARTRLEPFSSAANDAEGKLMASYELVSKIATVDLPLGESGFPVRRGREILESGYASAFEKCYLEAHLAESVGFKADIILSAKDFSRYEFPRPSVFHQVFTLVHEKGGSIALDPSLEVMPFGLIPAQFRGLEGMRIAAKPSPSSEDSYSVWETLPTTLPFNAYQNVFVTANLSAEGTLSVKAKYALRGDNELLLRVAFHQTPKERWKEVAGLLALSDGFRGTITNVTTSDPMATKEPFTVEYELTQAKFVDWSKKPVRIPALLPQIALPDAPGKTVGKIELGTPLEVQTSLKLQLPEGTTVQTPAATSVARDYATFASKYDGHLNTVSVSRHINFLKREIPTERAADYNAFLRAVQNDQAQVIVLLPAETQQENRK